MNRPSATWGVKVLGIFLVAFIGGAVGALGVWFIMGRGELSAINATTPRAEIADVSPTAEPTDTRVPDTSTPLPIVTRGLPVLAATVQRTDTPRPTPTARPTATPRPSLAQIYVRVNPSIVTVVNARSVPGVNNSTLEELVWGSGVIIDSQGYVLTNEHVAGAAQELVVTMHDGRTARARYIAGDGLADLALIKIEGDFRFQKLPWGNSSNVEVGDTVAVVGSPLGNLRNSVTTGIVSGLDRTVYLEGTQSVSGMIQTDAAINRGNSGGALVDDHGQLIGIVTLIIRQTSDLEDPLVQGIGFAIPANDARALAEEWLAEDN